MANSKDLDYTFYAEHITAKGDTMLIMSMSDSHLRSTIGMYLNKLKRITQNPVNLLEQLDPMSRIVLGDSYRRKIDNDKTQIPFLLARLNTYMSEAVLVRSMIDLISEYQIAVGRCVQLANLIQDNILEASDDLDSDPDYPGI